MAATGNGDGDGGARGVTEYPEGAAFPGTIATSAAESTPAWPAPVRARAGAPNVVYIVLDDIGFAQLGCYGGAIETPNIDRLAAHGLRFTNFHTTALCSPTRACLLTGRNHHSVGMGGVTEAATGFPGYDGHIPRSCGLLPEALLPLGYATFAVGKWHLTPNHETNMAARRDRWPLSRGFERYYGFFGGESDQWEPNLVYDNHEVEPPRTLDKGYHLTEDLTDRAISFVTDLKNIAPDKPFFLYFATGAAHAPHHVAREWADRYKGRFDGGWERVREAIFARQKQLGVIPLNTELPPRPEFIPTWDSLPPEAQKLYARQMEVFAGFVSHCDHHLGRLIEFLDETGQLENTLLFLISDNGASAEGGVSGSVNENRYFNAIPDKLEDNLKMLDELGGPLSYPHYAFGWAWCGNTPLKKWKREVHQGGTTGPLIVHWPVGFKAQGETRRQYTHAIDLVPTVFAAIGVAAPRELNGVAQRPLEGTSFAYAFGDPEAPSRHETQYYEMLGNRAIYHEGWKAVTYHGTTGCLYDGKTDPTRSFDRDRWELYHVDEDFSEHRDLAREEPERLRALQDRWWIEAGRFKVLPLDARGPERFAEPRPQLATERRSFVYWPGGSAIPEAVAVNVKNRSHTITAEVVIPTGGAEGVLLAHGGRFGGYSLYVRDRKLHYVYNYCDIERFTIRSEANVPTGECTLAFEFRKRGEPSLYQGLGAPGFGRLYINGRLTGEGELPVTMPLSYALAGEGLCVGWDSGLPVTEEYRSPFRFTGRIKRVIVDVTGERSHAPELEAQLAMTLQ